MVEQVCRRSTVDAIHIIGQIIKKYCNESIELQIVFIDFQQVFERLKQNRVMSVVTSLGLPSELVRRIEITIED